MRSTSALAIVSLTLGCTSGTSELQDDCYWIGSLNPLSGDLGTVGLPLLNAAQLAVQDVNQAGRIGGKSLCVAPGDTRTRSDRSKAIVEALFEKNDIRAVNGPAASNSVVEAVKATDVLDMALVSCCSTSPVISEDQRILRTVPSDALQGVVLAQLAAARGVESLSLIYVNDAYGNGLRETFVLEYERLTGKDPVAVVAHPNADEIGQVNYTPLVREAMEVSPELVVLISFPLPAAEIIKEWRQSGLAADVSWITADGLKSDQFLSLIGDEAPAFVGTAPSPTSPYFGAFRTRYESTFGGESPGIFTSNQYDAVVLIALAMASVGADPTPSAIRDAIRGISAPPGEFVNAGSIDALRRAIELAASGADIDYQGVSGLVDIDENGDVLAPYRLWLLSEGATQIVEGDQCFDCGVASATVATSCVETACPSN